MILAGVDLAWQSENNPSAIAWGQLKDYTLTLKGILPAVCGIESIFQNLTCIENLQGLAIDAPLIIKNEKGQRTCESAIGKDYGSRKASCHTTSTSLYPTSRSVILSERLMNQGFFHLKGDKWQIECYPHPSLIEIFGLPERLKYKKGKVTERRTGQKSLAKLLLQLNGSRTLRLVVPDPYILPLDCSKIEGLRGQALKSNEDALDAVVCLYIAGLYAINRGHGKVYGDSDSGYIWVPIVGCL